MSQDNRERPQTNPELAQADIELAQAGVTLAQANPWDELRAHTSARIALGRVGASLPTREVLKFGLAHAQARDAVHRPLDFAELKQQLRAAGFRTLQVHSNAEDRQTYLLRPDYGRHLHEDCRAHLLHELAAPELAMVIADGLSSSAVQRHALPLLRRFASASRPTGPTPRWCSPSRAGWRSATASARLCAPAWS